MKETFYDKRGRPTAYSDGATVFLFSGEPVAYFAGGSIYGFSGKHLGRLAKGWVRDNKGKCMFFTRSAQGGPARPDTTSEPRREPPNPLPVRVKREARPPEPENIDQWSRLTVEKFFNA